MRYVGVKSVAWGCPAWRWQSQVPSQGSGCCQSYHPLIWGLPPFTVSWKGPMAPLPSHPPSRAGEFPSWVQTFPSPLCLASLLE